MTSADGFAYRYSTHRGRLNDTKGQNIDASIKPTYELETADFFNISKVTELVEAQKGRFFLCITPNCGRWRQKGRIVQRNNQIIHALGEHGKWLPRGMVVERNVAAKGLQRKFFAGI